MQQSLNLLREPVSRTRQKVKQLRKGVREVDQLRQKKQQHGLAKMAKDSNNCKSHSSCVTECISDKNTGRVPAIVLFRHRSYKERACSCGSPNRAERVDLAKPQK